MKQQITPGLGNTKGDISTIRYGALLHFSKPSIDLHKSRHTCTKIFFGSDLHKAKKHRNVALTCKSRKHTS